MHRGQDGMREMEQRKETKENNPNQEKKTCTRNGFRLPKSESYKLQPISKVSTTLTILNPFIVENDPAVGDTSVLQPLGPDRNSHHMLVSALVAAADPHCHSLAGTVEENTALETFALSV
jgi:hypothetical protein